MRRQHFSAHKKLQSNFIKSHPQIIGDYMLQTEENIKEADEIFREILRESGMTDEKIENIEPDKVER